MHENTNTSTSALSNDISHFADSLRMFLLCIIFKNIPAPTRILTTSSRIFHAIHVCLAIYLLPTAYSEIECPPGAITPKLRQVLTKDIKDAKSQDLNYECDMEQKAHDVVKGKESRTESNVVYSAGEQPLNLRNVVDSWKSKLGEVRAQFCLTYQRLVVLLNLLNYRFQMGEKTKFGCSLKLGKSYRVACVFA
ncbi:hypothetical protein Y032_0020g74 [Ancylostoma ceylanicum]|nr:hypothetical protein Y032_0020g74 [Ancylostoma ceylanicum]